VLNELTLHSAPAKGPDKARAIGLRNAWADFSQAGWDVRGAVDGDGKTGWAVEPEFNKDHTAVFELAEQVGDDQPARLTVRLKHQFDAQDHNLGRFRLSFTNDRAALQGTRIRLDLKESELVEFYVAPVTALVQQGQRDEAVTVLLKALDLVLDRTAKAKIIAEAAPLKGVLEKLAQRAAGDAQFQAELARYYAERGNTPLADAARAKARALLEQKLAKEPENAALAAELADLLVPPIDAKTPLMVPTSENEGVPWRFSTSKPPANWMREEFDDSTWATGPGGFGNDGWAPGLVLRTPWKTSDIWLRRKFEWKPNPAVQSLLARVAHDESFELFINGHQILSRQGWVDYTFYPLDAKVLGLLKPGTNTLAVHCFNAAGAQHIDVGLCGLSSNPRLTQQRLTVMKTADPWGRLAAAYHVKSDQPALDKLLKQHPEAAAGIGDLYAAEQDWKRALAEYNKAITPQTKDARIFAGRALAHEKLEHWELAAADWEEARKHEVKTLGAEHPSTLATTTKLVDVYLTSGRTRDAVPLLAIVSSADPSDTTLALKVAALQAWLGQEKEFAATRRRILASAKGTSNADLANTAARLYGLAPSTDKAELEAALALGHTVVKLHRNEWTLLSPGMAEYRNGNYAAADQVLLDAGKANPNNPHVTGTAAFYRAMSLFRQGNKDEARKVAIAATAKMKPLPKDEQNPLAGNANHDDLILWLAYKEARALIQFDAASPPKAKNNKK